MNQKIVDYLQQNKEQYSQESLVEQLKNTGYKDSEVSEAIGEVYVEREILLPRNKIQKISKHEEGSAGGRLIGWITVGVAVIMNIVGAYKYFVETDGNVRLLEVNHFNLLALLVLAQALAILCLMLGMIIILLFEKNIKSNKSSAVVIPIFIYLVVMPVYILTVSSMGVNEYILPPALGVAFFVGIVLLIGGGLGVRAIRILTKNKQVREKILTKSAKQIMIINSAISILVIAEILIVIIVSPAVLSRIAYEFGKSSEKISKRQELRTCPNFNESVKFFDKVHVIDYYKSIPDGDAICSKVKQYEYGGGYHEGVAITVYVNANKFKIDGNHISYDVAVNSLKDSVEESVAEYNLDDGRGYYHVHILSKDDSRCEVNSAYFTNDTELVVEYNRELNTEEQCINLTSGEEIVEELRDIAKNYKLNVK
jgi:hypothetical protein